MNFGIDSITLWSKSGEQRSLAFERNRVNVLTGGSHTGKSALLDIIDYCFLASSHKLPDSIINENVGWYGLTFYVNDKTYTIARRSPLDNAVSKDYYFSSTGAVPDAPQPNTREDDIKSILEAEFHIDDKVTVAYGGRALKAGSKVSFRYFFLFNTISEDIITNSKVFFDKQSEERYQEALPRIFDMALGIDDLSNIAARERKEVLRKDLSRLQRKDAHLGQGRETFDEEVRDIAVKAAEYGLIDSDPEKLSIDSVRSAIRDAASPEAGRALNRYVEASAKLFVVERRLRKLRQFTSEYRSYKDTLKNAEDSLRPIEQLLKQAPTLLKSEIFDDLISSLKTDLSAVKKSIAGKQPVDGQISAMVKSLEEERETLQRDLSGLPQEPKSFASEREKWMFVGEAMGRFNAYEGARTPAVLQSATSDEADLQQQMDDIEVRDVEETRQAVVSMINEIALALLKETANALANYASYQTDFAYKEKRLRLRKPRSKLIENVGSSSNHMFLHLLHFLALHEVAISHKSMFIPSFLIIDQPSRPYYPDEKANDNVKLTNSDSEKVSIAFNLLNNFVARMNNDYQTEFQMIVFEHVPRDTFTGMNYVHLLPEFRNGEALIPQSWQV
ncbi:MULTISPECIES: DUF3732 domain-containing protein [Paraburkholderia]|uniref:DUF3732 domain-containing protein n=1 Tax=Paraburkholderia dioscoreae TaxID=2604047 RepID=A0A5Q4YSQ2_9BURK|nr:MULTISPECIES: DUF3732 domain-containing protein [Paraburkholderia]MDR8397136.1 DUF3732 domain-containing protein [Paraburkholderia sp. USG1]VVD27473.1 conserved protein of unknown function [Paraburkholderia dioscoreae]